MRVLKFLPCLKAEVVDTYMRDAQPLLQNQNKTYLPISAPLILCDHGAITYLLFRMWASKLLGQCSAV